MERWKKEHTSTYHPIPLEASEIHGIADEMVKRCSNLATYQGVKYGSPDRTSQFNGQL
jgi:hypothetical protein